MDTATRSREPIHFPQIPSKMCAGFSGWDQKISLSASVLVIHCTKRTGGRGGGQALEANIRQTIVYMQMLANFCRLLPIYNQATWKPIHPSAPLLPKMVVVLKENIQKMLNLQPLRLNITQNLLQMHKYKQ